MNRALERIIRETAARVSALEARVEALEDGATAPEARRGPGRPKREPAVETTGA